MAASLSGPDSQAVEWGSQHEFDPKILKNQLLAIAEGYEKNSLIINQLIDLNLSCWTDATKAIGSIVEEELYQSICLMAEIKMANFGDVRKSYVQPRIKRVLQLIASDKNPTPDYSKYYATKTQTFKSEVAILVDTYQSKQNFEDGVAIKTIANLFENSDYIKTVMLPMFDEGEVSDNLDQVKLPSELYVVYRLLVALNSDDVVSGVPVDYLDQAFSYIDGVRSSWEEIPVNA